MATASKCSRCVYGYPLYGGRTRGRVYACQYILDTGQRRPGPPPGKGGVDCIAFKPRAGRRINKNF